MSKLPQVKPRDIEKILVKKGFTGIELMLIYWKYYTYVIIVYAICAVISEGSLQ